MNDIIKKIYSQNYNCRNGHPLTWTGNTYVFKDYLTCDKCKKNSKLENPIRWICSKCNIYFCQLCYIPLLNQYCPLNHKYIFIKEKRYSNYVCDKCYKSLEHINGVLTDSSCNLTFCPGCFNECLDIPGEIED